MTEGPVKALVLAAGEGTRLRPLTLDRPKPMVPIDGRPLLEHTIALLALHLVDNIAINLSYRPEVVTSYFSGLPYPHLTYSLEDPILGTAGAAKKLAPFLDSTFFVIYGDVLTNLDLSSLLAFHRSRRAELTMATYEVEDPTRCGIVGSDEAGRVRSFVEKPDNPASNLANAGVYVVEPTVLDCVPEGFADFGFHVIPSLLAAGRPVYASPVGADTYLLDIGSLERYQEACRDAQAGRIQILHLDGVRP